MNKVTALTAPAPSESGLSALDVVAFLSRWHGTQYLCAIYRDKGEGRSLVRCSSVEHAHRLNAEGYNIYTVPNRLSDDFMASDRPKPTVEDVVDLRRIVLDLDPDDNEDPQAQRELFKSFTQSMIEGARVTEVVLSGRLGYPVLELDQPLANNPANWDRLAKVWRRMALFCGADIRSDPAHLYKCPGFKVWMSPEKAAQWHDAEAVLEFTGGRKFELDFLVEQTRHLPDPHERKTGAVAGGSAKEGWFSALPQWAKEDCARSLLEAVPVAGMTGREGTGSWLMFGMALHDEDLPFELWDEWSSKNDDRYTPGEPARIWNGFKGRSSGVGVGSIVYHAQQAGWKRDAWLKECFSEVKRRMLDARAEDGDHDREALKAVAYLASLMPDMDRRALVSIAKKNELRGEINLTSIKQVQAEIAKEQAGDEDQGEDLTHDGIARDYLEGKLLTTCNGELWTCDPFSFLWQGVTDNIKNEIAEKYEGQKACKRQSDYAGIVKCVMDRTRQDDFFRSAPLGIACPGGFVHVDGNNLVTTPLTADHRQTFKLEFDPAWPANPETLKMVLREGMGQMSDDDKQGQLDLLAEVIGAGLFGLLPETRRALILKGPTSCGKSTLLETIAAMLPPGSVCNVPPTVFDNNEAIAKLGTSRLNIETELKDTRSIAGAEFKKAVEGAPMQARKLYFGTYTMTPMAGHLYATNVWPTVDHPDSGFWERWAVVTFDTSKDRDGRTSKDEMRAKLQAEYDHILGWLFDGVIRFLRNGRRLTLGAAHAEGLSQWKARRDSVATFLIECESIGPRVKGKHGEPPAITAKALFNKYILWHATSSYRHPVSEGEFHDRANLHGGNLGTVDNRKVFHSWYDKLVV